MHKKLPQSTVKLVLPSNESYESKTGCNRTLATVLWVPLNEGVSGVRMTGWFPIQGGFGSYVPLYRHFLKQINPCSATLAEESYNV